MELSRTAVAPCSSPHDWRKTGEADIHVDFPTKNKGRRAVFAFYVRCRRCGQNGFRKPGSPVVYTWSKESEPL